jgi:agmatinase
MALPFKPAPVHFMGARAAGNLDDADAVLFGAPHGTPYQGVPNEPFAAAPDALRKALEDDFSLLEHWDFDFGGPLLGDERFRFADAGNLITQSQDGEGNRALIRQATQDIVSAGAVPVMLGGDDSTPIPFFEGLADLGPLTIIQIDAHIDWRDERWNERLGFSSTMRRASEMAHVERIVQAGIRGLGSARREEVEFARDWGAQIVTAREIHEAGIGAVMAHVPAGSTCVITLDCDGLDSGIMPAVISPTPGGLSYQQSIDLVAAVSTKARLAAFDMIEFVPERDTTGTATFTAARIVANVIGRLARSSAVSG